MDFSRFLLFAALLGAPSLAAGKGSAFLSPETPPATQAQAHTNKPLTVTFRLLNTSTSGSYPAEIQIHDPIDPIVMSPNESIADLHTLAFLAFKRVDIRLAFGNEGILQEDSEQPLHTVLNEDSEQPLHTVINEDLSEQRQPLVSDGSRCSEHRQPAGRAVEVLVLPDDLSLEPRPETSLNTLLPLNRLLRSENCRREICQFLAKPRFWEKARRALATLRRLRPVAVAEGKRGWGQWLWSSSCSRRRAAPAGEREHRTITTAEWTGLLRRLEEKVGRFELTREQLMQVLEEAQADHAVRGKGMNTGLVKFTTKSGNEYFTHMDEQKVPINEALETIKQMFTDDSTSPAKLSRADGWGLEFTHWSAERGAHTEILLGI